MAKVSPTLASVVKVPPTLASVATGFLMVPSTLSSSAKVKAEMLRADAGALALCMPSSGCAVLSGGTQQSTEVPTIPVEVPTVVAEVPTAAAEVLACSGASVALIPVDGAAQGAAVMKDKVKFSFAAKLSPTMASVAVSANLQVLGDAVASTVKLP